MSVIRCKLEPVASSNIACMGWAREQRVLVVVFHGGACYAYSSVDSEMWGGLVVAESKGRYLRNHIQPFRRGEQIDMATIDQGDGE